MLHTEHLNIQEISDVLTRRRRNPQIGLLLQFIKRNTVRLAVIVFCMQMTYIFFRVNIKTANRSEGRSRGHNQAYMYDYAYNNQVGPRSHRGQSKQNVAQHGHIAIVYEEDYDSMGGEQGAVKELATNLPPSATATKLKLAPLHNKPRIDAELDKLRSQRNTPKPRPRKITLVPPCTMDERLVHVKSYCNVSKTGDERPLNFKKGRYASLIVDEKHRVVYCDIPNVVSTLWSTFIAKATGNVKHPKPPVKNRKFMTNLGLRYLDSYSDEERDIVLKDYYKFVVVRHPFERMISIWRQKFVESAITETWRRKLGMQIIFKQRNMYKNISEIPANATARFEEFLEFSFVDRNMEDPNWFAYLKICHPCEIQYDGILRSETMDIELYYILKHFQDIPYAYNKVNYTTPIHSSVDILSSRNKLMEYQNVSSRAELSVMKRFHQDMNIFGYSWNEQNKTAHCAILTKTGRVCC